VVAGVSRRRRAVRRRCITRRVRSLRSRRRRTVDQAQAGLTSGLLNTGHELGASLGVALVSTIAGASVADGPLVGRPQVGGYDRAFLACAVIAAVAALGSGWLLPTGRPPTTDGPAFAH
jgi:hypothetical protein